MSSFIFSRQTKIKTKKLLLYNKTKLFQMALLKCILTNRQVLINLQKKIIFLIAFIAPLKFFYVTVVLTVQIISINFASTLN